MSIRLKIFAAWVGVFAFRLLLLPFRAPNVEPLMATLMPISKTSSRWVSFSFAFLGIVLYDAVTSGFGMWTLVTALAYGLVGLAAYEYFARREATRVNFITFAIISTIIYDLVTGLSVGPMFFGQPFIAAALGQVPFTILHLLGNITFAAFLSPVLYRWFRSSPSAARARVLSTAEM